jgi:hypothetical protein
MGRGFFSFLKGGFLVLGPGLFLGLTPRLGQDLILMVKTSFLFPRNKVNNSWFILEFYFKIIFIDLWLRLAALFLQVIHARASQAYLGLNLEA